MIPVRDWMRDRRVAAVLAAVAVLAVGYRWIESGKGHAPPVSSTSAPPPPGTSDQGPHASIRAVPPAPPQAPVPPAGSGPSWSWNRNPFLPPAPERAAARHPEGRTGEARGSSGADGLPALRGTVVSRDSAMAIFGDRLVPVGSPVGEWVLTRVEPYRVSLRKGKDTRVLELYKP